MAHNLLSPVKSSTILFDYKTAVSMAFAANTLSKFYHFVEVETRIAKTLCGLSVAMIIEPEPSSAALHLVSAEPPDYVPCNHCQRLTATKASDMAKPARVNAKAASAGQVCSAIIPSPLPELR